MVSSYNGKGKSKAAEAMPVEDMHVKMCPELRALIVERAEDRRLPMNEIIVQILAEHFGQPKLGYVPRRPMGRPRKELARRA